MKKIIFLCTIITAAAIGITSCTMADIKAGTPEHIPASTETHAHTLAETSISSPADTGSTLSHEPSAPRQSSKTPAKVSIPTLTVTCGQDQEEIPSSSGGYELSNTNEDGTVDGVIACGAEPLSYLMEKSSSIPYIKLGTDISLEFTAGSVPDAITLQDIILREDGTHKYDERATENTSLTCRGNTASFSLGVNLAAMLSSDLSSYEEGGILRGFRVNCTWENGSTAEYGFVLRTDASE